MELITTVDDLVRRRRVYNYVNNAGLVMTRGALHDGHLSLIQQMVRDCDLRMISIFLDPNQFASEKEYMKYPRNLERDLEVIKNLTVDVVFAPDVDEIYPNGYDSSFAFKVPDHLKKPLRGKDNYDFFDNVSHVTSKLINVMKPNVIYMGQKDFQQARITEALIDDLYFGTVDLNVLPTARAESGLAYGCGANTLNRYQVETAEALYRTLEFLKRMIQNGEVSVPKLKKLAKEFLASFPEIELEYLDFLDASNMEQVKKVGEAGATLIGIAGFIGDVRLTDNIIL